MIIEKKIIYWSVYIILLIGGMGLSLFEVFLLENTVIFLFGLMWIWIGISLILKVNPYFGQKYKRKYQILFSVTVIGLGIAWDIVSLMPLSKEGIPMIFVSMLFLILCLWIVFFKRIFNEIYMPLLFNKMIDKVDGRYMIQNRIL